MLTKKRFIDIGLVIIVIAMAGLVYLKIDQLINDIQSQFSKTGSSVQTAVPEAVINSETEKAKTAVQAQDFELLTIEGTPVSLSNYLGKPVMINFWAIWCQPCRVELPLIQAYADQYKDELVVLAVNTAEDKTNVIHFVDAFKYNLIFLLDSSGVVADQYRVRGLPTSIFVDKAGYIQATHIGQLDEALLTHYLRQVGVVE